MNWRTIPKHLIKVIQQSGFASYIVWFGFVVGILSGLAELFAPSPCPMQIILAALLGLGGIYLLIRWFFPREESIAYRRWDLLLLLLGAFIATFSFSQLAVHACRNECPAVSLHAATPGLLPGETAVLFVTASDPEGDEVTFEWEATAPGLLREGPSFTIRQNEYTAPLVAPPAQVSIAVWADDHHCGQKVSAVVFLRIQPPTPTPTITPSSTPTFTPTPTVTPSATSSATPTPTVTPSATPTPTVTVTASSTPTVTLTSSPVIKTTTPTQTVSPSPGITPPPGITETAPPPVETLPLPTTEASPTETETPPTRTPPPG